MRRTSMRMSSCPRPAAEKDGTFTSSDRRVRKPCAGRSLPGKKRGRTLGHHCRPVPATLRQMAAGAPDTHRQRHVVVAVPSARAAATSRWSAMPADEITRKMRRHARRRHHVRATGQGGVHWPCPAAEHPGTPYLFAETFPSGRGKLWPVPYETESELPDADYPFILSTGRVLYHWHGGTMTRVSALDAAWPECTVELHPHDAARLGLETGDWVEVASRRGAITARLLVTGRSPEGTLFIPFHFAEAAANVLTDNRLDRRAKIPDYKVCAVTITRAAAAPGRAGDTIPLTDRGAIKDPTG